MSDTTPTTARPDTTATDASGGWRDEYRYAAVEPPRFETVNDDVPHIDAPPRPRQTPGDLVEEDATTHAVAGGGRGV